MNKSTSPYFNLTIRELRALLYDINDKTSLTVNDLYHLLGEVASREEANTITAAFGIELVNKLVAAEWTKEAR
jgi:hypothetical protein